MIDIFPSPPSKQKYVRWLSGTGNSLSGDTLYITGVPFKPKALFYQCSGYSYINYCGFVDSYLHANGNNMRGAKNTVTTFGGLESTVTQNGNLWDVSAWIGGPNSSISWFITG